VSLKFITDYYSHVLSQRDLPSQNDWESLTFMSDLRF